ncbi:MAG: biotin--[acetyl-CoA-carboxylase] ligase [Candidatus Eisenbacteria bacterium]|nr:biotin--[acetyl-CoA-carboxylase] ligase [Candidatus Eisenbacteria bacterium]
MPIEPDLPGGVPERGTGAASSGRRVLTFERVDSTNEVAWREAERGVPEWTWVSADEQTGGRGRLSRRWHSPAGLGVWTSVVLRPGVTPSVAPGITMCASLAVARTLRKLHPMSVSLKWPNDVMVKGRKICGILTEMKASGERVEFVVCGIGINLNQAAEDFPAELRDAATSVFLETGHKADKAEALAELMPQMERVYAVFLSNGLQALMGEWRSMCPLFGKIVRMKTRGETVEGVFHDIDASGALVLRLESGVHRSFLAGDVEPVS